MFHQKVTRGAGDASITTDDLFSPQFCLERTKFNEEQIVTWFQKFVNSNAKIHKQLFTHENFSVAEKLSFHLPSFPSIMSQ